MYTNDELLIFTDDGFKSSFKIPSSEKFYPWIELFLKADVQVSGKSKIRDIQPNDTPNDDNKLNDIEINWFTKSENVKISSNIIKSENN